MRLSWWLQWRPVPHLSPQPGQSHRRVLQSIPGCACCQRGDVRHLTVLSWAHATCCTPSWQHSSYSCETLCLEPTRPSAGKQQANLTPQLRLYTSGSMSKPRYPPCKPFAHAAALQLWLLFSRLGTAAANNQQPLLHGNSHPNTFPEKQWRPAGTPRPADLHSSLDLAGALLLQLALP